MYVATFRDNSICDDEEEKKDSEGNEISYNQRVLKEIPQNIKVIFHLMFYTICTCIST